MYKTLRSNIFFYYCVFQTLSSKIFSLLCVSDLKLHLQSTDYGNFLANEPSPLSVSVIDDKLREKLVIEFQHLRNHCLEPLATFLDYMTSVPELHDTYHYVFVKISMKTGFILEIKLHGLLTLTVRI